MNHSHQSLIHKKRHNEEKIWVWKGKMEVKREKEARKGRGRKEEGKGENGTSQVHSDAGEGSNVDRRRRCGIDDRKVLNDFIKEAKKGRR